MKKLTLLVLFLANMTFAQNANLDREYFTGSYVKLPAKPILDKTKHTFSSNTSSLAIAGYKKVVEDASLVLNFRINGTIVDDYKIKSDKHERKDKAGKVISTTYTYKAIANYTTTGSLDVLNTIKGESNVKEFSRNSRYQSKNFKTYSQASEYYRTNKYNLRNKYHREHRKEMSKQAYDYINDLYGYPIHNQRDNFWILGKKKHPEYANHIKAYNKAKNIFDKMKYNEPINSIETEMQPVITYFIETATKYQGNKKKMRKMRYASYYNLAKIYYYLDNPDKTIEYGQKIMDNGYDKYDGKYFISLGNRLKKRFNANKVSSRHFEVSTTNNQNISDDFEEDNSENTSNEILAYLITKSNDTIQAVIPQANLTKIKYFVDLEVSDASGAKKIERFKAIDVKTMALTNEDLYKVISFAGAKEKDVTEKFVKVLFESDKIGLYLFNNNELVLKQAKKENGTSTLSPAFVFGLNKKLSTYAKDCPDLLKATQAKQFKNNQESLLDFVQQLTDCK